MRDSFCACRSADRISSIPEPGIQESFRLSTLGNTRINNMFASYKGEGTGAVRHMFAHHILKPERTPLEANVWGTAKSSGAFTTIFEGRIRRAIDYAENPSKSECQKAMTRRPARRCSIYRNHWGSTLLRTMPEFAKGKRVYLSCGDSRATDLPDASVDAVITDPPFFDNVHYSQLADFFHVWQQHVLGRTHHAAIQSTRSEGEVQNEDATVFTRRLTEVWFEAHRLMKNDGLLASRTITRVPKGGVDLDALMSAGFVITAAHPIKAEMSVAMPKHQRGTNRSGRHCRVPQEGVLAR